MQHRQTGFQTGAGPAYVDVPERVLSRAPFLPGSSSWTGLCLQTLHSFFSVTLNPPSPINPALLWLRTSQLSSAPGL